MQYDSTQYHCYCSVYMASTLPSSPPGSTSISPDPNILTQPMVVVVVVVYLSL